MGDGDSFMLMVEWVGTGYIGADATSGSEHPAKFATDRF